MSLDLSKMIDIIEIMENYVESIRPPEDLRDRLDITYTIDNQSIILEEVRPVFNNPSEYRNYGYAKTTFIKTSNTWKVYWMRSDLKWHLYEPCPEVTDLREFIQFVEEDQHHCFKG